MCSAVRCDKCGKATWEGCGQHIEEALAPYSKEEKCECVVDLSSWVPSNQFNCERHYFLSKFTGYKHRIHEIYQFALLGSADEN